MTSAGQSVDDNRIFLSVALQRTAVRDKKIATSYSVLRNGAVRYKKLLFLVIKTYTTVKMGMEMRAEV
jgi:hypothetical protein